MAFLLFEDVPRRPYTMIGLGLIVLGYLGLNMTQERISRAQIFIPSSKPARQMLVVTFLWGITPILERNCLNYVSPVQFGLFVQGLSLIFSVIALGIPAGFNAELLPIFFGKGRTRKMDWELVGSFMSTTILSSLAYYIYLMAVRSAYVSFAMIIKRLSIIFTVFLGHYFFPGDFTKMRFLWCIVLQIGCALVYLPEYGFWFAKSLMLEDAEE
jgi:drug/metabolite transporter (DMT)-like permease